MSHSPKSSRRRIGVICHSPSAQMSAQYDQLAELEGYEFVMVFRRRQQGNAAWAPRLPSKLVSEFLPAPTPSLVQRRFAALVDGDARPLLQHHDFDGMILHGLYDSTAIWQAIHWCRRRGRPYWLRCDANLSIQRKPLKLAIRRILAGRNVRGATGLLCIGSQNRDYYRLYGARDEQMFIVPWEVDYAALDASCKAAMPRRDEVRRELGVQGRIVFLSVARLVAWKGYDILIPAIAQLAAKGLPVHLLIVGEGPYASELQGMVTGLGAPVTLLGNKDRQGVAGVMAAADALVLASHDEPWGLVINEAAICGLPIIASSAVGAATELVRPDDNGFVFPAGSQAALTDALLQLCSRGDDQRRAMGQQSRDILHRWRTEHAATDGYKSALDAYFVRSGGGAK